MTEFVSYTSYPRATTWLEKAYGVPETVALTLIREAQYRMVKELIADVEKLGYKKVTT